MGAEGVRIFPLERAIRIDFECEVDWWPAESKCPACGKTGNWRMGQEFHDEMRCADCSIVWVPERRYLRVKKSTAEAGKTQRL